MADIREGVLIRGLRSANASLETKVNQLRRERGVMACCEGCLHNPCVCSVVAERDQLRRELEEARAACEDARETLGEIRALAEMEDPGGHCETITKWARRCCNRLDGEGGA